MASRQEDKIQVYSMVLHEGQVNRARYNPFKHNLIATKSSTGDVFVHNYFEHSKEGKPEASYTRIKLVGHDSEGFGLSWSDKREGMLLSSANDGKILAWDISKVSHKSHDDVPPTHSFQGHISPVSDVSCHKFHLDVFASCDDEGNIFV